MHDLKRPFENIESLIRTNPSIKKPLVGIYNQLKLVLYKLYNNDLHIVDLKSLITNNCNSNYSKYISKGEITINCDTHSYVLGNYMLIQRVLNNMIENSIKSTQDEIRKITLNVNHNFQNLKIILKDNGIGIKKENIKHIFKDGYSLTGGTGKGLSFANYIIHKFKGQIECISQGNSTTFTITLPYSNAPKNSVQYIYKLKSTRIIIIDDETPEYLKNLSNKFDSYVHLKNKEEVLLFFKENNKYNCLFLIDYNFNEAMNGIDIIKNYNLFGSAYIVSYVASFLQVEYYSHKVAEKIPFLSKIDLQNINFRNIDNINTIVMDDDVNLLNDLAEINSNNTLFLINFLEINMVLNYIKKDTNITIDSRVYDSSYKASEYLEKLYCLGFVKLAVQSGDVMQNNDKFKILPKGKYLC